MLKELEKIFNILYRYGKEKIINATLLISSIISPIFIWYMLYYYMNKKYFSINIISQIGLFLLIIATIYLLVNEYKFIVYDESITLNVDLINDTFDRPSNHELTDSFKKECSRFLKPYIYLRPLMSLSSIKLYQKGIFYRIINLIICLIFSYSLITYILFFQDYIVENLTYIILEILQYPIILNVFSNYSILLMLAMFCIHIYNKRSLLRASFSNNDSIIRFMIIILSVIVDFSFDLALIFINLLLYPFYYLKMKKTKIFIPFIFPGSVHLALQATANFIGVEPFRVGSIDYSDETEEGVTNVLTFLQGVNEVPYRGIFHSEPDFPQALYIIKNMKPTVVLGLSKDGCEVLGKIFYDRSIGCRKGIFYIRKPEFIKEFIRISDQIMIRQRQLKPVGETLLDMLGIDESGVN